jgi:dipeptidyl aminopeptidase/acylaminoacyl peptidase
MKRVFRWLVYWAFILAAASPAVVEAIERRPLTLDDLGALRAVSEPRISPDGAWVVYTVGLSDFKEDKQISNLWMTRWDGSQTLRLTTTKESEHHPGWSPDGQYLSFLSGRGVEGGVNQLWLMNRLGGEAERITDFKGAVTDYAWSPDSRRLVLVVEDPDPESAEGKDKAEKKTPKPIVIDRFHFKEDGIGYLRERRQHLYLFELSSRRAEILTPGSYDEWFPDWSPTGSAIALVSKRGEDFDRHDNYDLYVIEPRAGAVARQLTTFSGPDCHPHWESRPAWSPDGLYIAYLQGGPRKLIDYAIHQLAVISAAGGPAKLLTASLDRNVTKPRWSADGSFIYFLLEDDRNRHLARLPAAGGTVERVLAGRRDISSFDPGPGGKMIILESQPDFPSEVFALGETGPRPLSGQNRSFCQT